MKLVVIIILLLATAVYLNRAFIFDGVVVPVVNTSGIGHQNVGYGGNTSKEIHGKYGMTFLDQDLNLFIKHRGKLVQSGRLSWNKQTSSPKTCSQPSDAGICYEWPNEARLTIKLNRSVTYDMDCYDIEWTALRCVDQVLTDCYSIGSAHWYGGYENKQHYWPLSRNNQSMTAYVSNDIYQGDIGDVLERYFFSSKGTGIFVDDEVPLYYSMNEPNGFMCYSAKYEMTSYQNFDNKYPVLKYKICQADNVKSIHTKMVAMVIEKPTGIPDKKVFQFPIWSTWAEYKRAINQSAVLSFARDILANHFSNAQLEIDDIWTPTYGDYEFDRKKFPDAAAMVRQLNDMGFRVTVWVNPFFNINSTAFAEGALKSYFIRSYNTTRPALIEWWDGDLAGILDPTNPDAVKWYLNKLENLKKAYNISSFKFDAGESNFLPPVYSSFQEKWDPNDVYPKSYIEMAVQADSSRHLELRVGYRTQQYPAFVRVMDKDSKWDHDNGVKSTIPVVLTFGLLGYPFILPDMIGGNAYNNDTADAELYVRWVELNAFLPSMQYSIVPWRYNKTVVNIAQKYTKLHEQYSPLFIKLAQESTITSYPIIRPIWWIDPDSEDALTCDDEFLVGEEILVAPIVEQGARERDIYLPPGTWQDELRNVKVRGPQWLRKYRVELHELAYFSRSA